MQFFCWPSKARKQNKMLQRLQCFLMISKKQQSSELRLQMNESGISNIKSMLLIVVSTKQCSNFNVDTCFKYCVVAVFITFYFDFFCKTQ